VKRPQTNGKQKAASAGTTRVAIYVRQSVADHEKEFGSIEAQIEAAQAFILSQRHAGWAVLPEPYSDHGYSGSTTERPAFQRLLGDLEAGRIDVVCVYRTDRLSRSLLDFAKLMALFEHHGVAFVSVTESFDTSTPMGRMVLNLLATFAQFERETIAARTKDKMLATRRRGAWTGGRPVLGFDIIEKKLIVNVDEAEQVRAIFATYLELGSLLAVVDELRNRGGTTKSWTNAAGKQVRGSMFTKSSLYSLLTNPIYCGRIRAGDEIVDGAHEAIIPADQWQAVQDLLHSNHVGGDRRAGRTSQSGALLAGIARCSCGATLSCTYTTRGSKRYGYYQCARMQREGASACPGSRVAAGEFESFVFEQIRQIGRDPSVLAATLEADRRDREARRPELIAEVRRLTAERTRLETERKNVVDAVAQGGAGTHVLLQKLDELDGSIADAEGRASAARVELQALELAQVDPEELRVALEDLEPIWSELFPRERARVLGLLLEQVVFDAARGEVELTFRPGGPRALRSRTKEVVA
jgi:site-specific DNA recombinase